MEVRSPEVLAECLNGRRDALIGIDGYHGVGKTTIARDIAARLGIRCVHLDDFLIRHRGSFVEHLRYDELSSSLRRRPVVVEGVCLRAVLERLSLVPDVVVYVRTPEAVSHDVGSSAATTLFREVSDYHRLVDPLEKADIVYTNAVRCQKGPVMVHGKSDVDIAFIQAKTKLAMTIAVGGMLALIVGLAVLMYGVTGSDHTLVKLGTLEMSASGLGGVIMATSALWAFFAYKARPVYARGDEVTERFDADSQLVERRRHRSTTEIGIAPPGRD